MNSNDFDNLAYLLQFSPAELQEWMKTQTKSDQAYALDLLALAPHEILDIAVEVMAEFPEAMAAIKPFMLQK